MPALRHGVGLGFQSVTPIGPLQLDLALNPQAAFLGEPARTLLVTELEEPVWRAPPHPRRHVLTRRPGLTDRDGSGANRA
jgi:hypothetical protein